MKGLLATILNIKPIIAVEKDKGMYVTVGQDTTLKKSILKIVEKISKLYSQSTKLRVQPLHSNNLEGVQFLKESLAEKFHIFWEEATQIAPVLGAHTGAGLVGCAVGVMDDFAEVLA